MNKALAMKWVKALRSGKYKQGKTFLKKGDKYCCLGVLCDITGTKHDPLETSLSNLSITGVKSASGSFYHPYVSQEPGQTVSSLAALNDLFEWNFNKIADFIEKRYKDIY